MKIYLITRLLQVLHIAGIVIMAGTTMIDYLTFNTFWRLSDKAGSRALGLIPLMARYGAFIRTGAITLILTGIILFILDKGSIWSQPWFKIKVLLVIALILNGLLVGNRQGHKLRETIMAHEADYALHTVAIRESMDRFYPVQLTLFFLLIAISVIRPRL